MRSLVPPFVSMCVLTLAVGLTTAQPPGDKTPAKRKPADSVSPDKMQAVATRMKDIALGLHFYSDKNRTFPPAAISGKDGKPLLSWRVAILPLVNEEALYRRFRLDEPWDSPNNKPLLKEMPRIYQHSYSDPTEPGMTHFQVLVGPGTVFEPLRDRTKGVGLPEITDGTSNTLLVAEATTAVPWTKPQDLEYDPKKPLPELGILDSGFHAAIADGSPRFIKVKGKQWKEKEAGLRLLITRNDGMPVPEGIID